MVCFQEGSTARNASEIFTHESRQCLESVSEYFTVWWQEEMGGGGDIAWSHINVLIVESLGT